MEGYSMKKILLSLSIAVVLLSNQQQSFAMKQDQDDEKKIIEKTNKKRDRDEFDSTEKKDPDKKRIIKKRKNNNEKSANNKNKPIKNGAFIFEKLSELPSKLEKIKDTDLNLDFLLGSELSKKIEEHNKIEESLTNDIVDNILNIRLDKPFVPSKEEFEKIKQMTKENDFPAPDKELENLRIRKPYR